MREDHHSYYRNTRNPSLTFPQGEVLSKNKCAIRFDGDLLKPENPASGTQTFFVSQFGDRNTQEARQPFGSPINLASREQRPAQQSPLFRQPSQPHLPAAWIGILPTDRTPDDPSSHRYDTDMSSSDQQTTTSTHPTPNPSHHSSSNTSYSSPHLADDVANPHLAAAASDAPPPFFAVDQSFAAFTPHDEASYSSLAKVDAVMGAFEWRGGSVVGTPSAGTGLSPLGEGEWTRIMEGMGWDGGGQGSGLGSGLEGRSRDE